jgi:hypothetical protein
MRWLLVEIGGDWVSGVQKASVRVIINGKVLLRFD